MPKKIELTIEIGIQKVSCPGVWLCQDGHVSLTIYALGNTYQTCLLPPVFPLPFKDVFYFRKVFQETCSLNNMTCLLKDETIYCELVQWCQDCDSSRCVMLAQYLGALSEVLFPPDICSTDGVDLLMRRTAEFPGILSPKIEITTKVRIDEVWDQSSNVVTAEHKICLCHPTQEKNAVRRNQVCHSAQYHRLKCGHNHTKRKSRSRSRSRSLSEGSKSYCSLTKEDTNCCCPKSVRDGEIVAVNLCPEGGTCPKVLLKSRFIDQEQHEHETSSCKRLPSKITPCICEICKKYHEIFHSNESSVN